MAFGSTMGYREHMGNHTRSAHRTGALLMALALGCGGTTTGESTTAETVEVPPAPTFTNLRVLTGADGVRVSIAEFDAEDAYVKIMGIRSPVAGIVFPATVVDNGRRLEWVTTRDGRPFHPIHRESLPGGSYRWMLYAPGLQDGVVLERSEELSGTLDGAALHEEHYAQVNDGTLERVQSFDREAAQERNEEALARYLELTERECGSMPEWTIDWESISDEVLKEKSISSYCDGILSGMRNVCRFDPGKQLVATIESVTCRWNDGAEGGVSREGNALSWVIFDGLMNASQVAREALMELEMEGGQTLADEVVIAQTDVCVAPDEEHVVFVHPHRRGTPMGISYGTTETVFHAPQPEMLGRGWFFEPREIGENRNTFRGFDLRFYSYVEVDDENPEACKVVCGDRETAWTRLPAERAREVLANAETRPTPFDREPYALARDRRGVYYYVDRGNTPDSREDFRVYRGRRGNLERLQMQDIVSDSEGQIFATASGSLRLLVDADDSARWIEGERPKELRRVPVEENYNLIMDQLGVYLGERLELPCDDY